MRLSSLAPLPAALVSALAERDIRTETDLLFLNTRDDIFRKLPPGTTSLHELTEYIALVAERLSAFHARADSLLGKPGSRDRDIETGNPALDNLFRGIAGSNVLELSGDKGSGKTTIALHAVLRHLATHDKMKAVWIDTTGEFTVERLPPILHLYGEQTPSSVLDRLQVSLAPDIDAAYTVLENIITDLGVGSPDKNFHYVVLDSVTELFGPLLSAVSSQGHAIMTTFMRQLRNLAQNFSLTILVINNATMVSPNNPYSAFATTVKKPALGPSFTYLTDATIWLARSPVNRSGGEESVAHIAEIFRAKSVARSLPDGGAHSRYAADCSFYRDTKIYLSYPELVERGFESEPILLEILSRSNLIGSAPSVV